MSAIRRHCSFCLCSKCCDLQHQISGGHQLFTFIRKVFYRAIYWGMPKTRWDYNAAMRIQCSPSISARHCRLACLAGIRKSWWLLRKISKLNIKVKSHKTLGKKRKSEVKVKLAQSREISTTVTWFCKKFFHQLITTDEILWEDSSILWIYQAWWMEEHYIYQSRAKSRRSTDITWNGFNVNHQIPGSYIWEPFHERLGGSLYEH